jgi:2-methylcitrate dehydratase PrpD
MKNSPDRANRRLLLKAGVASALAVAARASAQPDTMARSSEKPADSVANKPGEDGISPLMRTVSTYIARAGQTALPDQVTEATKHHLLDTLAAMVSGSHLLPGRKAIAYVRAQRGAQEACVPGSRVVTTVVNAALAGGMLGHSDETDDVHGPSSTHPGCGTVPAALAMAESVQASGTALLRAVALGYDIGTRLAMALGGSAFSAAGHATHSFGPTFGGAAACASLARFNPDQVRHLLSYCSHQASGISYWARDTEHVEKSFVFGGMPARNGAAAATMVAAGMTGVDDAFSGERNFFFAFGPKNKPEELIRELGERFEIGRTDIKRWAVGAPIQAALDSVFELVKENKLKAGDVEKAVVRLSHQGVRTVDNRAMPDICLQHMVAVMLMDGIATFDAAHDVARMKDPKVLEVRRRIELVGDDELERLMPSRQAIVELKLRDGRELRRHTQFVRGTAQNPMNRQEVDDKCYPLFVPVLGKKRAHGLIDAIWRLESVKSVRTLRPLLMA